MVTLIPQSVKLAVGPSVAPSRRSGSRRISVRIAAESRSLVRRHVIWGSACSGKTALYSKKRTFVVHVYAQFSYEIFFSAEIKITGTFHHENLELH